MTLTKDQIYAAQKAAQPLAKWLAENCHPHVTAIVDSTRLEIAEGIATVALGGDDDEPANDLVRTNGQLGVGA